MLSANVETTATLLSRHILAIDTENHGRDQVLIDLVRNQFPIKKISKEKKKSISRAALFCCKTAEVAKEKHLGMRIRGMQSTQHGAEPPLKQLQVVLNMSESSEGTAAVSAITTCTLRQAGFPSPGV